RPPAVRREAEPGRGADRGQGLGRDAGGSAGGPRGVRRRRGGGARPRHAGEARGGRDPGRPGGRGPRRGAYGSAGGVGGTMAAVWGALKRTVREFREDNLTDWAAALTYYAILAIFPALIVLVSILGLVGEPATQPLIDNLGTVAPGPAKDIFTNAIKNLQGSQGAAGVLFVVGLAGALWSASGYVGAFMRASNAIYDMPEGRPVWKTIPTRVGLTLVLMFLLAITALAVVLTGGL